MIGKVGIWFWIVMITVQSVAQQLPQGLTQQEKNRYQKASMQINRAEKAHNKVMLLNQNIDSLVRSQTGGVLPKRLSLQNEIYQRTISAGSLFTSGYGDVFTILTQAYQRYQKQNPQIASQVHEAVKTGDAKMRTAHQLYRQSRRVPNEERAVDMALQALALQKESIDQLLHAGTLLVQAADAAVQERLLARHSIPDTARTISMEQEFDNAGHRIVVATPPATQARNVYYTVQFKTLTRQETPQNIKTWYSGKETVEINRFDQYYRYSVGRFTSLAEANTFIEKEKMMGFVVAYQDNNRIAVVQARKLLGR